ncbi:MAG TPA: hypothetical protein VMH04_08430 [Candidatus Solibacter sp.]|nr:hypothetical protein [Candidatus Solibacter sp.]
MATNRKVGAAIALVCTSAAALGLVGGFLSITTAVGIAVIGIVIGTGVARGNFSSTPDTTKRN